MTFHGDLPHDPLQTSHLLDPFVTNSRRDLNETDVSSAVVLSIVSLFLGRQLYCLLPTRRARSFHSCTQ